MSANESGKLILPPKKRKLEDPDLKPVHGRKGTCQLCGNYEPLSETHVLPQAAGNAKAMLASSYLAYDNWSDNRRNRRFPNGVAFRTFCQNCNNRLGANEEKELIHFAHETKKYLRIKNIITPNRFHVEANASKPIKAVLCSFLAANDIGHPTKPDQQIRDIYFDRLNIRESAFRIYVWPYNGTHLTVIRYVSFTTLGVRETHTIHLLKLKPLAFAVTLNSTLPNLTLLNSHVSGDPNKKSYIPMDRLQLESNPMWPATVEHNKIILTGGNTFGFTAVPLLFAKRLRKFQKA